MQNTLHSLLAFLMCMLLLGNTAFAEDALLCAPNLPDMPAYPGQDSLFSAKDSGMDAYEAWINAIDAQHRNTGYHEHLTSFLINSTRQILSNAGSVNRVYSPLSLYMAAAMLAETTQGTTRAEILMLLGAADLESLRTHANDLWNANYRVDGLLNRTIATSVWLSSDVPYRAELLTILAEHYYSSAYRGVMGSDELNAALQNWLNENTLNMLSEQSKDITLSKDTVLALASAVAFQGKWSSAFYAQNTAPGIFHAPDGDVTCDFMYQSNDDYLYSGASFKAVRKDFSQQGNMWFILPDEGTSPDDLLQNEEALQFMFDRTDWPDAKLLQINLSVPKFDISSRMELSHDLQALGVSSVFDPYTADFTPLTEDFAGISLSQVQHDARVKIDEDGCEAAAYTVMMLPRSAMHVDREEIDFVLDRPFLFVITGANDLPLFVGIVNQP